MKINPEDIQKLESIANTLKAISHPVRIVILNLLDDNEKLSVTEIHNKLGLEQSTASHHLGILKDKGVLASRREGKNIYYFLKHENFSNILECINKCPLH